MIALDDIYILNIADLTKDVALVYGSTSSHWRPD